MLNAIIRFSPELRVFIQFLIISYKLAAGLSPHLELLQRSLATVIESEWMTESRSLDDVEADYSLAAVRIHS